MEPVDTRTLASPGQHDDPVVFEMVPLEGGQVTQVAPPEAAPPEAAQPEAAQPEAAQPEAVPPEAVPPEIEPAENSVSPDAAPSAEFADVVVGLDPLAQIALSVPQVQPPIGSGVSLLEAALSASPAPGPVPGPVPMAASASTPLVAPSAPASESAGDQRERSPDAFTLPDGRLVSRGATSAAAVKRRSAGMPMLPVRIVGVGGTAAALALSAWQTVRVFNGQERVAVLSIAALLAAAVGALGVVLWTWIVTANSRRVMDPARTQELPDPGRAAMTWIVPFVFIVGASVSIASLSSRFHSSSDGTESALPFIFALVAMILALPMMYSPVTYLSGVVRKVGGHGIRFAEWIWVPVALAVVGALMIAGLRFGGAFGDDVDGLAPAWIIGVAAIVPAVVIVYLGWRVGGAVEADIGRALDRRHGVSRTASHRAGKFAKIYADGGPNHAALRQRGLISLVPGGPTITLVVSIMVGGLALLSLVGGVIMVLFWQEARDGVLLPSQTADAWSLVERLQAIDHMVLLVAVGAASLWSLVVVTNVRLASARRRNPLLAAAAWPAAAGGIWIISSRTVADGSAAQVLLGFVAQAVVLAVPLLFMYRAAGSIGSRRQAIRITWAIGVVLLVHVQGLGGLSTAATTVDSTELAQLCGYLVISAVVQVLLMFAAAAAMREIVDTTTQVADRHNALIAQREQAEVNRTRSGAPAPRLSDPGPSIGRTSQA